MVERRGTVKSPENVDAGARVFISYSRGDVSIAEPLRDALRQAGFDAYLDLHDIAPGEDWKARLGSLIASAEKVVFLISPDSVASEICAWEVDEAEGQGKSVLPIVVRETEVNDIPGRLRQLNFIFYRNEIERAEAFTKLSTALSVDLAWEREKTRVNDLAITWENAGRPRRLLTWRDDAIRALEKWRDGHPATSPSPTELQMAYISESRRTFSARQRLVRSGLAVIAIITTALGGISFYQAKRAEDRLNNFKILQSQTIAQLSLDSLKTYRFDDARLYAITAEKTKPTHIDIDTVDLALSASNYLVKSKFLAPFATLQNHNEPPFGVSISDDHTRILSWSLDGTVSISNVDKGVKIFQKTLDNSIVEAGFFKNNRAYTLRSDGVLNIIDAESPSEMIDLEPGFHAWHALFDAPRNNLIVYNGKSIKLINGNDDSHRTSATAQLDYVIRGLILSEKTGTIITYGDQISIYSADNLNRISNIRLANEGDGNIYIDNARFYKENHWVAWDSAGTVISGNLNIDVRLKLDSQVFDVQLYNDFDLALIASKEGIYFYDKSLTERRAFVESSYPLNEVFFDSKNGRVFTKGFGQHISVHTYSGQLIDTISLTSNISAIDVDSTSGDIAVGTVNGTVSVLTFDKDKEKFVTIVEPKDVFSDEVKRVLFYSGALLSYSKDGFVRLLHKYSLSTLGVINHDGEIRGLISTGSKIVSWAVEPTVKISRWLPEFTTSKRTAIPRKAAINFSAGINYTDNFISWFSSDGSIYALAMSSGKISLLGGIEKNKSPKMFVSSPRSDKLSFTDGEAVFICDANKNRCTKVNFDERVRAILSNQSEIFVLDYDKKAYLIEQGGDVSYIGNFADEDDIVYIGQEWLGSSGKTVRTIVSQRAVFQNVSGGGRYASQPVKLNFTVYGAKPIERGSLYINGSSRRLLIDESSLNVVLDIDELGSSSDIFFDEQASEYYHISNERAKHSSVVQVVGADGGFHRKFVVDDRGAKFLGFFGSFVAIRGRNGISIYDSKYGVPIFEVSNSVGSISPDGDLYILWGTEFYRVGIVGKERIDEVRDELNRATARVSSLNGLESCQADFNRDISACATGVVSEEGSTSSKLQFKSLKNPLDLLDADKNNGLKVGELDVEVTLNDNGKFAIFSNRFWSHELRSVELLAPSNELYFVDDFGSRHSIQVPIRSDLIPLLRNTKRVLFIVMDEEMKKAKEGFYLPFSILK